MPLVAAFAACAARALGGIGGLAKLAELIAHESGSSLQNATTGASLVLSKPNTTASGRLVLAAMGCDSNGGVTWTGDTTGGGAAWTEDMDLNDGPGLRIAHCTAGASEPANYTFTANSSSTRLGGFILCFPAGVVFDAIGASDHATGGGALTVPSFTPTLGATVYLLVMDVGAGITVPNVAGFTEVLVDTDAQGPSYRLFRMNTVAAGPVAAVSVDTSAGSGESAGVFFSVKQ